MAAQFTDLRDFIATLEAEGQLVRISTEVDPNLEMTEIADRTLRGGGPALLFENPKGYSMPVLANLFGTETRVARGMGATSTGALREIGELLAYLRQPDPPKGMRDLIDKAPLLKKVLNMGPKTIKRPPCQEVVLEGDARGHAGQRGIRGYYIIVYVIIVSVVYYTMVCYIIVYISIL